LKPSAEVEKQEIIYNNFLVIAPIPSIDFLPGSSSQKIFANKESPTESAETPSPETIFENYFSFITSKNFVPTVQKPFRVMYKEDNNSEVK
jgi:hypothetical protein